MSTVVILLAVLGCLGGLYAALKADVQVAGLSIVLVGLAVLLPLVVR